MIKTQKAKIKKIKTKKAKRKKIKIKKAKKSKTKTRKSLTHRDHKNILKFYKMKPASKKTTKKRARKVIAKKLCSCIKKVNKKVKNEPQSIAICTDSVINKKRIRRGKFTCKTKNKKKPRQTIQLYK
jgi:hypothetical protein